MKIRLKKTIKLIKRTQSSIQNRSSFFTMDRNERVDEFSQSNVRNCIRNIGSFNIRTYPNNYFVYKKIANWLNLKKENILITDGAEGALLRFMSAFANVKDKVIYLDPSFGMYKVYCDIFRLRKYPLKLDMKKNFNFFNQLIQHIEKVRPNIIIIANPNQPIETMLNFNQIKYLCKIANKMKFFLVIDEAYYHFNNISAQRYIKKFNNLVVLRTFSKAFGLAGLRIGYCMSNKKIIDCMQTIKPIYEINSINIKILLFFLKNIKIMKKYVKEVNKSRIYLYKFFKNSTIKVFGEHSNNVLIEFKNEKQARFISKKLYKNKFLITIIKINNKLNFARCTLGSLFVTKKFCRTIKKNLKIYN